MKTSRGSVRWLGAGVLTGILATAPGARAQVVHSENFETGGLGAYTEDNILIPGSNSLWHGDAVCGGSPVPPICLDDDTSAVQAMPFPFSFVSAGCTQFRANCNGFVIMNGTGSTAGSANNGGFSVGGGLTNIVCPWWDNQVLTIGGTSRVSTLLTGSPGNQVLTVQWTCNSTFSGLACPLNDGSRLSYQVQFYQATGNIEFHYDTAGLVAGSSAMSASVGARAAGSFLGIAYSIGFDATGLGSQNTSFPTSDIRLTFVSIDPNGPPYTVGAIAPSWSSVVGLPGETILLEAVGGGAIPMPASFGTNAASYNRGDELPPVYNYSTGGANSGAIESPVFAVPAGAFDLAVTYDTHREMETAASFDQCFVEARGGAAPSWGQVFMQTTNSTCSAGPTTVTASSTATQALAGSGGGQIRFRVETVDGVLNETDGWSVDNISVAVASVPGIARMAPPSPCAGSGGCVPGIGWSGGAPSVSVGGSFALTLSQVLGGAPVLLDIGNSVGFPLPFDLGLILGGGPCYLLNNAGIVLSGSTTAGSGPCAGTLSIPVNIAGVPPGGPIFAQFFVIDPASPLSGLPVVASDQLAVTLLP